MTDLLGEVGNPSSLHASGRAARRLRRGGPRDRGRRTRRPAERGPLHRRRHREPTTSRSRASTGQRRSEDPARRRILASAVEHHAVMDAVLWLAEHEGADGRVAARRQHRPGQPRDAASRDRERPGVGRAGHRHVGQQRGRHRAADRGARRRGARRTASRCTPTRCRRSAQLPGRLRGERAGRDDRDRPQDRRAARRRRRSSSAASQDLVPVLHGGGQERDVRSGTLDTPAIVGLATAAELAVEAPGGAGRERVAALRDDLVRRVR